MPLNGAERGVVPGAAGGARGTTSATGRRCRRPRPRAREPPATASGTGAVRRRGPHAGRDPSGPAFVCREGQVAVQVPLPCRPASGDARRTPSPAGPLGLVRQARLEAAASAGRRRAALGDGGDVLRHGRCRGGCDWIGSASWCPLPRERGLGAPLRSRSDRPRGCPSRASYSLVWRGPPARAGPARIRRREGPRVTNWARQMREGSGPHRGDWLLQPGVDGLPGRRGVAGPGPGDRGRARDRRGDRPHRPGRARARADRAGWWPSSTTWGCRRWPSCGPTGRRAACPARSGGCTPAGVGPP